MKRFYLEKALEDRIIFFFNFINNLNMKNKRGVPLIKTTNSTQKKQS